MLTVTALTILGYGQADDQGETYFGLCDLPEQELAVGHRRTPRGR